MSKTITIDDLMSKLAIAEAEVLRARAEADRKVQEIKQQLKDQTAEDRKTIGRLKRQLKGRAKKAYEAGTSHHKTAHGTVAVRRNPPKLEVADEQGTLRLLRAAGRTDLIRMYEEPDLDAMAGEDDTFLMSVGITRKQGTTINIIVEHVMTPRAV